MTIKISLPELKLRHELISKNTVSRVGEKSQVIDVEVIESNERYIEVKLSDGRGIRLLKPRVKADEYPYSMRIKDDVDENFELSEDTILKWLNHPCKLWPEKPSNIVENWANKLSFIKDSSGSSGFRVPQLGALHAISAHWSISSDPSIIVMPTGTGKTETMLATSVYHQCEKVLIIVPSDALRTQIFEKFVTLGCLEKIGCLEIGTNYPIVGKIKVGLKTAKDAKDLIKETNVLIATASVLSNSSEASLKELAKGITHVFVDEAHHIKAPTWEKVSRFFETIPILQFTATPFRNDRKKIPGKIIYNYPLGKAQDASYFKNIELLTVDEINDDKSDIAIAERAVEKLRTDLEAGYDHLILARTKTVKRAEDVLEKYVSIGKEYDPVIVHSRGMSRKEREERIEKLRKRESRILICVDMFGEGFDFPNLKIAAMHDIHKTLPITLQFIGRFTRVATNVGDAAVVINLDDPKTSEEIQELYSKDANWNSIVRRASEERISDEIDMQEFINSFEGSLPNHLPLWNMRPGFSTLIFQNPKMYWNPKTINSAFSESIEVWSASSELKDVVVAVIAKKEDVKWGRYENVKNHIWNLIILHFDRENSLVYLHQSDYKVVNPLSIAKQVCGDDISLVVGPKLFRVFSKLERPMIKNLGASKSGTISFTMYFGPEVSAGLSQVEKAQSELNNMLGWGYEDGYKITVGSSHRKGKVWAIAGGSIRKWIKWCHNVGKKVFNDDLPDAEVIKGFLRPEEMKTRPNKVPLTVEWGEWIFRELEDRVTVFFGEIPVKIHQVDIFTDNHSESGNVSFKIQSESNITEYELEIVSTENGSRYIYRKKSGPSISIKRGSGQIFTFEDWMVRDPVIVMYGDGSFSYNNYLVEAPCVGIFEENNLVALDWSNVDIRTESQGKERQIESIQHFFCQKMLSEEDYDILFDDDAKGEAADIIGLRKDSGNIVTLVLVHCKYSSEKTAGSRVSDFYEVCGQAQKSIKWKHRSLKDLIDHMKKRELRWKDSGHTRFMKGNFHQMRLLERFARKNGLRFEIRIVQPGLSKAQISEDIKRLLGTTEQYLKKTSEASFEVYCSD